MKLKQLCMIVLVVAGATWAYAQQPSNLVGSWVGLMGTYEFKLVLNADGSAAREGMTGTWRAQGNKLYLTANNETDALDYHFEGARLVLTGEGLESPLALTRQGGGTSGGGQAPRPGPATTGHAPGSKRGLSQAEIIQLLDGDVPPQRISDLVEEQGITFTMTPAIVKQLQAKGASPDLIEKLKGASGGGTATVAKGDCHATIGPNGKSVLPPGCKEEVAPVGRPTVIAATPKGTGIFINEQELTPQQVQALRVTYGVTGQPGHFWYDRMNGSWGFQGGPAAGIIMPGLNLGGPLRADASNGDTGVFINGRQLHRIDVQRLMQLGPVYQGRYWMDAQGNVGLEGGPPLINIWAAAAARSGGGRREGILSTYDKTGIAVIGY